MTLFGPLAGGGIKYSDVEGHFVSRGIFVPNSNDPTFFLLDVSPRDYQGGGQDACQGDSGRRREQRSSRRFLLGY
jgi:hypothetical protein